MILLKQLAADYPSVTIPRQLLASSYKNLGILLSATGRPKEAEAAVHNALFVLKQLVADYPAVPEYRLDLSSFF